MKEIVSEVGLVVIVKSGASGSRIQVIVHVVLIRSSQSALAVLRGLDTTRQSFQGCKMAAPRAQFTHSGPRVFQRRDAVEVLARVGMQEIAIGLGAFQGSLLAADLLLGLRVASAEQVSHLFAFLHLFNLEQRRGASS